ncbi:MAG: ASCH domain-containing protein [Planctomyces sp.]|nr:ASCH domain-containing protein [Planctomyces sp.]
MLQHPDPDLIALGIRQPWAELILRGIKTIEVRTVPTGVRGPIYLYTGKVLSTDDVARAACRRHDIDADSLPLGRLVGVVEILDCRACAAEDASAACVPADVLDGKQGWVLGRPVRLPEPMAVRFLPYGIWFYPFRRKGSSPRRRNR